MTSLQIESIRKLRKKSFRGPSLMSLWISMSVTRGTCHLGIHWPLDSGRPLELVPQGCGVQLMEDAAVDLPRRLPGRSDDLWAAEAALTSLLSMPFFIFLPIFYRFLCLSLLFSSTSMQTFCERALTMPLLPIGMLHIIEVCPQQRLQAKLSRHFSKFSLVTAGSLVNSSQTIT